MTNIVAIPRRNADYQIQQDENGWYAVVHRPSGKRCYVPSAGEAYLLVCRKIADDLRDRWFAQEREGRPD